jgi:hypothetical protein
MAGDFRSRRSFAGKLHAAKLVLDLKCRGEGKPPSKPVRPTHDVVSAESSACNQTGVRNNPYATIKMMNSTGTRTGGTSQALMVLNLTEGEIFAVFSRGTLSLPLIGARNIEAIRAAVS